MVSGTERIYDPGQVSATDAPFMAVHNVGFTIILHRRHEDNPIDPRTCPTDRGDSLRGVRPREQISVQRR